MTMSINNIQNDSPTLVTKSIMTGCQYYYDLSSLTTTPTTSSSSNSGLSSYSISITPTEKERSSSPPRRFKGVVPQPNGRWGAQLYNGNKRVWIGTYDTQHQAAHAYDLAVIRFRGAQAITNFSIRHYGKPHLEFLVSHTQARVIDMLRNHTYQDELARFMRARLARNRANKTGQDSDSGRELLFKKVMTPSDVGRLHRLVIPKHYAESYLPKIVDDQMGGEVMLSLEDENRDRMWRFKYCYWKSSQNYVLTKGWGEFVKDKGLKPGDTVLFYCNLVGNVKRFSIQASCKDDDNNNNATGTLGSTSNIDNGSGNGNSNSNSNDSDEVVLSASSNVVLRLFGVDICSPVVSNGVGRGGKHDCGGGRSSSQLDGGEVVQTEGR